MCGGTLYRGDVITMDCVERLIRKNGMLCPITGKVLKDSDIIRIVRVSVKPSVYVRRGSLSTRDRLRAGPLQWSLSTRDSLGEQILREVVLFSEVANVL